MPPSVDRPRSKSGVDLATAVGTTKKAAVHARSGQYRGQCLSHSTTPHPWWQSGRAPENSAPGIISDCNWKRIHLSDSRRANIHAMQISRCAGHAEAIEAQPIPPDASLSLITCHECDARASLRHRMSVDRAKAMHCADNLNLSIPPTIGMHTARDIVKADQQRASTVPQRRRSSDCQPQKLQDLQVPYSCHVPGIGVGTG